MMKNYLLWLIAGCLFMVISMVFWCLGRIVPQSIFFGLEMVCYIVGLIK